ncbi:MAG: LacI family transcriptional regulator, partial [Ramlibacter sp.]|nr:LacI family transcriptional regulator [Ramlibacter sp.]
QDLLGGEIDVVMSVTQFAAPFVGSGKMRMLAVTGATRQKDHPAVPSCRELGLPAVSYRAAFGLAVPKGTPPEMIQKIYAGVRDVISATDFQEKFLAPAGYELVASNPQAFGQSLVARRQKSQKLITELDIHID